MTKTVSPHIRSTLLIAGEIAIRIDLEERKYTVGDVAYLPANVIHSERYGPDGVEFLLSIR